MDKIDATVSPKRPMYHSTLGMTIRCFQHILIGKYLKFCKIHVQMNSQQQIICSGCRSAASPGGIGSKSCFGISAKGPHALLNLELWVRRCWITHIRRNRIISGGTYGEILNYGTYQAPGSILASFEIHSWIPHALFGDRYNDWGTQVWMTLCWFITCDF